MTIVRQACYIAKCDTCGRSLMGFEESYVEHFVSQEAARKACREAEWDHEGIDTDYCDQCVYDLFWRLARLIVGPHRSLVSATSGPASETDDKGGTE